MPPILKLDDQNTLVPTSAFPHAKWKYEKFNPVQSRVFEHYDKDVNGLIAASTSSGKTCVAEIMLSHEMRVRGGKGLYLVPMRALAQEKIDEWTDPKHHFKDKKISICTGDYRLTKERFRELAEADLVIMTSEMLSHRAKNYDSEQNHWLKDIGTLIIDELHLLTVPGRGDHLEAGLMKFTEINPNARLIGLSATMPNVEEIAEWFAYSLTKKETFCLRSKYRPCPLNIHYEAYYDGYKRYDDIEGEKVSKAIEIIEYYPNDKFLVFAHTKRTGELMKNSLRSAGIKAEFHNASLDKKDRILLETKFRDKNDLRVIVATSSLAWGCNFPARRVIITGIHRGLDEVAQYDIQQMVGRSGRAGLDPQGDAYILLPESKMDEHKARLKTPQNIESQLLSKVGDHHKVLAFHLISEIHHGYIQTIDDVHRWYKRSLAYFQNNELDETVADKTIMLLRNCGAIWIEDDEYKATSVGQIASMFYFSPFDVSDLKKNFVDLFSNNKQDDDYWLSIALGNIDSQRMNIVSRLEKDEMSMYAEKIRQLMGSKYYNDAGIKAGFCYFQLLNGNNTSALASTQRTLQFDYNRLSQVLIALDTMGCKWGRAGWFRGLEQRIASGVPMYLVELCRISNIGKVRAKKLYDAGIKTVEDFADMDPVVAKKMLNVKDEIIKEMLTEAQSLALIG